MNTITTLKARQIMCEARANGNTIPKITHIAFGRGGVSDPLITDTALKDEIGRLPVEELIFNENKTSCKYRITLKEGEDFANEKINELALVDEDENILAIKTFSDKIKDNDMEMVFEIEDIFD